MMTHGGCTLEQLNVAVPGKARFSISARRPKERSAQAIWACGCRAEGPHSGDLIFVERCQGHGAAQRDLPTNKPSLVCTGR